MSINVVIGAQWGDEGKGKIVDIYTEYADLIVRFQGGNNAGHTLVVDHGDGPVKTVLHLIPSGILYPSKTCVIASGVVVDLDVFFKEIAGLHESGHNVGPEQLRVCKDAHVIMPYHRALDIAREARRGAEKIGTTGRGIGPAYEDKAARVGVRMRDLLDSDRLRRILEHALPEKNALLTWLGAETFDAEQLVERYRALGEQVAPFLSDARELVSDAYRDGKHILFEGAQGTLLDVGHGTYPFVTSSHTTTGGVCIGAGVPPASLTESVGIAKAYITRVGSGPFPTELDDEVGAALRAAGQEFGATTGRPRRCGWFDAVAMRASQRINGFTGLMITKLDVLTGIEPLKIATAYDTPDGRVEVADLDAASLEAVTPVYESLPGWTEDLTSITSYDDLPANARAFVERLSDVSGVPLAGVSIGPGRLQTILLQSPFGA
ncbi:MAG: adenylosuccinate synthase [Flavobacteriales bacterium]|jgi:adenylosuccinate synthase